MRDREIGKDSFLGAQQSRALSRYEGMLTIIRTAQEIEVTSLYAYMFEDYGCTENTVARYLKVANSKNRIKIETRNKTFWVVNTDVET